ncbi:MAG: ribose-phosphate pyrophosphokinase, partial [Victivallaceae bacterium]|nr:ribose-phosphate pyrophosphokinase [Victivallaceae bacterium]
MPKDIRVYSGSAHPKLSKAIADYLEIPLGKINLTHFPDGEIFVQFEENIRRADVFLIQPTCTPTNENLMELLIMMDAAKRASAARITVVVPYYGYARQDRKDRPRVPITAKLVANLLVAAGANRIITMDLHSQQIQGFFDIPVDHLYARPVFVNYIQNEFSKEYIANSTALAPDIGSAKPTRKYCNYLGMGLAIIDKRRPQPGMSEVLNIIGDVEGKNVWVFDDLIDTAGTICNAAETVMKMGALEVNVVATH